MLLNRMSGDGQRVFGGNRDRNTRAPETSDAADIAFLPKKRAPEGPGPPRFDKSESLLFAIGNLPVSFGLSRMIVRQSRSSSLIAVLLRVCASTRLTITAQARLGPGEPSGNGLPGSAPGTTTE
jgi:hypothetical protein